MIRAIAWVCAGLGVVAIVTWFCLACALRRPAEPQPAARPSQSAAASPEKPASSRPAALNAGRPLAPTSPCDKRELFDFDAIGRQIAAGRLESDKYSIEKIRLRHVRLAPLVLYFVVDRIFEQLLGPNRRSSCTTPLATRPVMPAKRCKTASDTAPTAP